MGILYSSAVLHRSLDCRACHTPVKAGESLITCMKAGVYSGSYIHQDCARQWYLNNPETAKIVGPPQLQYSMPNAAISEFARTFASGTVKLAHMDATAGSGKTNALTNALLFKYDTHL